MKKRILILVSFFILLSCLSSVNANYHDPQQAPFSIDVNPKKKTVQPGDEIAYTIDITADSTFNESIEIELHVQAPGYDDYYAFGIVEPPYPKKVEQSLKVPEDIPASVTVTGTIIASSMYGTPVTDEVEITIKSGNIIGDIIGWILGLIQAIINWFNNLF
jgi:hypothetical protein